YVLGDHLPRRGQARRAPPVPASVLRRFPQPNDDGARQTGRLDRRGARCAPQRNRARAEGKEAVMAWTLAEWALAIGRSTELSIVIKATVVVGLTIVLVRLARSVQASVRHVLLAATFGALLALPLVALLLPPVAVPIPTTHVSYSIDERAPRA